MHLKKTDATYGTLYRDIDFYRSTFENRENTRLTRERQVLEDEQQQLTLTKEHIQMNLKNIDDEQENTEKSIERQTMEHQGDFKRLTEKNKQLHKEIEELRALLELKLQEKNSVEKDLGMVTEKIDVVRAKYGKQLEKVASKKERALEELSHNESEFEKLNGQLGSVAEQEALVKEKVQEYLSQQEIAQSAREAIRAELASFDEDKSRKEQVNRVVVAKRQALELERVCLKELMDSIASTDSEIKKIEIEIESQEQNTKVIEEKIPQLEKEKKVAATARNFLEANKLAKEIKDKKEEIENIAKEIAALKQTRENLTTSMPANAARLAEKEAAVQKAKYLHNIKKFFEEHQRSMEHLDLDAVDREINWCAQQRAALYEQYRENIGDSLEQTPQDTDGQALATQDQPEVPNQLIASVEEAASSALEPESLQPPEEEVQYTAEELVQLIGDLQAEYDKVEKEIEDAAENDQFELADQLNSANSQRKHRLDRLSSALERIQAVPAQQEESAN